MILNYITWSLFSNFTVTTSYSSVVNFSKFFPNSGTISSLFYGICTGVCFACFTNFSGIMDLIPAFDIGLESNSFVQIAHVQTKPMEISSNLKDATVSADLGYATNMEGDTKGPSSPGHESESVMVGGTDFGHPMPPNPQDANEYTGPKEGCQDKCIEKVGWNRLMYIFFCVVCAGAACVVATRALNA